MSELTYCTHGRIAQWLEHLGFHQKVLGSIPSLDTLVSVDFIILTCPTLAVIGSTPYKSWYKKPNIGEYWKVQLAPEPAPAQAPMPAIPPIDPNPEQSDSEPSGDDNESSDGEYGNATASVQVPQSFKG